MRKISAFFKLSVILSGLVFRRSSGGVFRYQIHSRVFRRDPQPYKPFPRRNNLACILCLYCYEPTECFHLDDFFHPVPFFPVWRGEFVFIAINFCAFASRILIANLVEVHFVAKRLSHLFPNPARVRFSPPSSVFLFRSYQNGRYSMRMRNYCYII